MKKAGILLFVLTILNGNLLAQESQKASEEVRAAIQKNFQAMGAAMTAGNATELATYFTENALLKFPGAEPLIGRQAIAEAHQQMIDRGIGVRPNTVEVQAFGNMAYELGTYQMLDKEGHKVDQGHYTSIWEKEKGRWRISRDMISSTEENAPVEEVIKSDVGTEHLYVELWTPKQAWLDLSPEQRQEYFQKVGGEIQKLTQAGVEILGFAVNQLDTPFRSDYRYIAVWKMPTGEHVEMLEKSVAEAGWYTYFNQVNARGELIPPPAALEDMVKFK